MKTRTKRAYRRGSIRKRGNSYSIAISLGRDPGTGKYKYQWTTVPGTRKDAERKLTELLHQVDVGVLIQPGKIRLGEYLDRWLKDYVWPNLAPRTAEGYTLICRHHFAPSLGNMTLTGLKPEHLQRFYSEKLSGGLSATTVRHHHTCLHKALETAVQWGLLARNTADAVSPPRAQGVEMQTWDAEDITTFLEAARQTPYFALFHTAFFTGMRRSELLALRWCDLDLLLCRLSVTRSLHVLIGGQVVIRQPKTAKGRRMIDLSPLTASVLREHREKQQLDRAMLGVTLTDDNLVFSQFDGKPLLPNTVTHAWIKLVRRTGLKPIRLHDARHSHASLMLKQGTHPKIVQERLGHASIQITLDTYSHVAPGLQEAAAARFDQAFTGQKKEGDEKVIDKLIDKSDYVNH
ncbi:putative prophage phiRv2 integrase [subsurface metagenome]